MITGFVSAEERARHNSHGERQVCHLPMVLCHRVMCEAADALQMILFILEFVSMDAE